MQYLIKFFVGMVIGWLILYIFSPSSALDFTALVFPQCSTQASSCPPLYPDGAPAGPPARYVYEDFDTETEIHLENWLSDNRYCFLPALVSQDLFIGIAQTYGKTIQQIATEIDFPDGETRLMFVLWLSARLDQLAKYNP